MPNSFSFSSFAKKNFSKLEKSIQERIQTKLQELKQHESIFAVLKPLTNFTSATHRLRIGEYRVILKRLSERDFLVIEVGHRRDVYR